MPTTIHFAPTRDTVRPKTAMKLGAFLAPTGCSGWTISVLIWALVMLSIGAAAHSGAQSPELSSFELFALL